MPPLADTGVGAEGGQPGNALPANPSVSPLLHPSHLPGSVGWEGAAQQPPQLAPACQPADRVTDPSLCSQARLGQIKQRGGIMELGLLSTLPWRTIFLQTLQGKSNALLC